MAGYWPSFIQERGQYQAILIEQAWSSKGFIIWLYLQVKTTTTKQNTT